MSADKVNRLCISAGAGHFASKSSFDRMKQAREADEERKGGKNGEHG